jgi:hypothetical protein
MSKIVDQVNEIIEQTKLNKIKLDELRGLV